jgi:phage gp36-like protein
MAYCTLTDLKKAIPERNLIQITDDENLEQVNTGRVTQAIEDADNLIDSYLRGKHTVPLSDPSPRIRRLSVDFAVYYLYRRRMEFETTDALAATYKEGIRFLEGVRDGKNIIDDPDSSANTAGIFKTNKVTTDRVFNACKLAEF